MTSTLIRALFLSFFLFLFSTSFAFAENSLSVSITPPLFQLTIGPGESWSSAIKVVNNNSTVVTYYTQAVDFEPQGEQGNGTFVPLLGQKDDPAKKAYSVATWLELQAEPVTVAPGQTAEVSFTVRIPQNAEPGGHYGAILIGTQPGALAPQGALVKVSSYVSSLIFVRIKGDVQESGRIREFSSTKSIYDSAQADFVLRFENTGNTHVKPEGDITIYNMWGKERGKVSINQDTGNFGNVLPKSIRRFQFSWEGEDSAFDIGLYSAVVTLAYGEDGKKNVSATTYFWIVPIVPVATTLGILLSFIVLMTWFIRRYIRRALSLEKERLGIAIPVSARSSVPAPNPTAIPAYVRGESMAQALIEPLKEGVVDLRAMARPKTAPNLELYKGEVPQPPIQLTTARSVSAGEMVKKYKLFLLFIASLFISVIFMWFYFNKVLVPQRHFQIMDVKIQEETPLH